MPTIELLLFTDIVSVTDWGEEHEGLCHLHYGPVGTKGHSAPYNGKTNGFGYRILIVYKESGDTSQVC